MNKIIVPAGTTQKFEQVFEDLQTYIKENIKNRLDRIIGNYGVQAEVKNGVVTSNDFKVEQASPITLSVAPGTALTQTFQLIKITDTQSINLENLDPGNYTVIAKATTYTDTPVALINGFLYTPVSPENTVDTREHETYELSVVASGISTTASEIYLANISWDGTVTTAIYDRRNENVFSLRNSSIDDTNILKKDRNSTVSGEITFIENQGFGGKISPEYPIDTTGTIRATEAVRSAKYTGDNNDVLIQPENDSGKILLKLVDENSSGQFLDSYGSTIGSFNKDGFIFEMPIIANSGLIVDQVYLQDYLDIKGTTEPEFRVGYGSLNGGAGVKVLTEDETPSKPINFRIFDVNPLFNSKDEKKALVTLKWNYDNIVGGPVSGETNKFECTELKTTVTGENILDETVANLVGKYLYFPSEGTKYAIMDYDNSTKYFTLFDYSGETAGDVDNACAIVTDVGDGYEIFIKSSYDWQEVTGTIGGIEVDQFGSTKGAEITNVNLNKNYINAPATRIKITLEDWHYLAIRSLKGIKKSNYTALRAGTYDPDHMPVGQNEQSYEHPFYGQLPMLEDDGELTLIPQTYGFEVRINGWGTESEKQNKQAHEFEMGYAPITSGFLWSGSSTKIVNIGRSRSWEQPTTQATAYTVAVRPYQNKQLVGSTKTATVATGGGGIPPLGRLVATKAFNITNITGNYDTIIEDIPGYCSLLITGWDGPFPAGNEPSPTLIDTKPLEFSNGVTGGVLNWTTPLLYLQYEEGGTVPAAPGTFSMGNSKENRRILRTPLTTDTKINYVNVDITAGKNVSTTTPAILRVYQEGNVDAAGTLNIYTTQGQASGSLSVEVQITANAGYNGTRILIVDLYDPDTGTSYNDGTLIGTVELYGETIVGDSYVSRI